MCSVIEDITELLSPIGNSLDMYFKNFITAIKNQNGNFMSDLVGGEGGGGAYDF